MPESLNLVINKSPGLEKIIGPEPIKRIESLFNEKLAEKNITLNANSQITLKILIEKYDDGNVLGRGITGAIFGINIGEPAKIEGQITISENQKKITKANISVESSRSGWNFSYGYSGAKGMEKGFVEEATKILFETLAD